MLGVKHLTAAAINVGMPLAHRVHLAEVRPAWTSERVEDAIGRDAVVGANVEETATRFHISIIT